MTCHIPSRRTRTAVGKGSGLRMRPLHAPLRHPSPGPGAPRSASWPPWEMHRRRGPQAVMPRSEAGQRLGGMQTRSASAQGWGALPPRFHGLVLRCPSPWWGGEAPGGACVCKRRSHHLLSPRGMGSPYRGRHPHQHGAKPWTPPTPTSGSIPSLSFLQVSFPPNMVALHPTRRLLGTQRWRPGCEGLRSRVPSSVRACAWARRGPEGPEGARAGSTASPALNLCPGRGLPGACPGGGVRAGSGGRGVGADPARPGGASLFRSCVRAVQRRHLEGAVRPLGVTLCCREPWAGPQLSAQPGLGDVPGTHPRLPSLSVTPQHQCGECPVGQAPVRSLGSVSTGQATQLLPCSGVGSLRVVTAGRREAERGHAGPCWAERGLRAQPPGLGTWRPALRPSCGAARWGPEGPADMPRGLRCRARARQLLWGSILG